MLKKITALLLLTAFTNVYAITPIQQSAVANELNKTFDSLNYKLNVEWNQKDVQFFDDTIADFENDIAGLQEQGVTNNDLIKYTTDKIKDEKIQNEINQISKVITDTKMSKEEARAFLVSKLSSTYSQGASWSGKRIATHTAMFVGTVIILALAGYGAHECVDNDCL